MRYSIPAVFTNRKVPKIGGHELRANIVDVWRPHQRSEPVETDSCDGSWLQKSKQHCGKEQTASPLMMRYMIPTSLRLT